MKWIGQNIYDQVSKFRNTVDFSEDVTFYQPVNDGNPTLSIGSSATNRFETSVLYNSGTQTLDQVSFKTYTTSTSGNDGKFLWYVDEVQIATLNDNDLVVYGGILAFDDGGAIVSHNSTASSATEGGKLTLRCDDGAAMASGHRLGVIEFRGAEDASGTLSIGARIEALADGTWSGSENKGNLLFYTTDGTTESEVLKLDSDKLATFAGAVTVTGALTGTLATAAQPNITSLGTLTGITLDGDRDVTPGDGAVIHVDAHDVTDVDTSASGTAAMYTHINIEAPRLTATNASVTTTAAATLYINNAPIASTNQTITNPYALWVDDGLVKFDGALTVGGTITGDVTGDLTGQADTVATIAGLAPNTATTQATQPAIESIGTDGDTLSILGDRLDMENTTTYRPQIRLMNTTEDANSSNLAFWKTRKNGGTIQDGVDNDEVGAINFWSYDDGSPTSQQYARIYSDIHDATSGEESGRLTFQVANHDGGLGSGLILTGGSANDEIDVTVGLGADSVTTVAGDLSVTGDTNLYARSTITFATQATMLSSGNWVTTGQGGISNHSWNQDMGVNTETNGTSAGSLAKQYGHMGIRVPYACVIENIYAAIRNSSGNRQATVGLFCARAADGTTAVDWGTTDATEPILQIHADANNESGSYQNRPTHAEASVDVVMAAGDMFYPALKLTGVTSSGNTDTVLASFSVGIKTLIA